MKGISRILQRGMRKPIFNATSLVLIVSMAALPARAYDFSGVAGHVTTISPVGMPAYVEFGTDTMPSQCNGALFYYPPSNVDEATQEANTKAVMAVVLSAQLSGHQVYIYGIYPTSSFNYCTVQWIIGGNQ